MKPVVRVQNISKRYRIGSQKAAYGTLRDALTDLITAPLKRFGRGRRNGAETLWALKDVSFEIEPGEVVGVVGRNGAGKSTLLKILSRITEPTSGRVELYGRVGSLLEVGTGFHSELTGRENVFLYGAILGMSRAEIKRKFDEIVAFSEVERFIDTPVKWYSTGMYMRLAFSVPAHLEPEIMVLDEVLAVGDMNFQQKCFNRIKQLKEGGTTVLLVSHNMWAIQTACKRCLYLRDGKIEALGESTEVVQLYRDCELDKARDVLPTSTDTGLEITGFEMFGADGKNRRIFTFGEEVRIRIDLHASRRVESPLINFGIRRTDGVIVCNFNHWFDNFKLDYIEGSCTLEGWLPPLRLIPHYYEAHVLVWQRPRGELRKDLSKLKPLAAGRFGEFSVEGPPLTDQDGVFQEPARRWVLTTNDRQIEFGEIDAGSLVRAFGTNNAAPFDTLVDPNSLSI